MKTAKQKAEEFIGNIVKHKGCLAYDEYCIDRLTKLLREQDRYTRRACAGAVLGCKEPGCSPFDGSNVIRMEDAHSAVMNTKAV